MITYGLWAVPVIAIFTKFDSVVDRAYNQLRKDKIGRLEAKQKAPSHASELFKKDLLVMIYGTNYGSYVCLSSNCQTYITQF
jgi:hypothetical protein